MLMRGVQESKMASERRKKGNREKGKIKKRSKKEETS